MIVVVVVVVVAVAAVLLVVAQCSGKRELACNLGQLGLVQNLGGGGGKFGGASLVNWVEYRARGEGSDNPAILYQLHHLCASYAPDNHQDHHDYQDYPATAKNDENKKQIIIRFYRKFVCIRPRSGR